MSNLKTKFGQNLKKIRKSKNLTQEQLAELLGIGLPNISYIENGKTYPSVYTVEKICTVLNVEPFELYNFTLNKNHSQKKNEMFETIEKDEELFEKLYRIFLVLK